VLVRPSGAVIANEREAPHGLGLLVRGRRYLRVKRDCRGSSYGVLYGKQLQRCTFNR